MGSSNDDRRIRNRDSVFSAIVRFCLEILAWVAIGIAFGWLFAIVAVLAMAILSTPGDKRNVLLPVPGPIRLLLESGVFLIGVAAAGLAWGVVGMTGGAGLFVLYLITNRRRLVWLMAQSR